MKHPFAVAGCLLAVWVASPEPAFSQSRTDEIARQQAEKAQDVEPYTPNTAEKLFEGIEDWFSREHRWLPTVGSVYPTGGFTAGVTYKEFIGYDSYVAVTGLYSMLGYKKAEIQRAHAGSSGRPRQSVRLDRLARRDPGAVLWAGHRLGPGRRDQLPSQSGLHVGSGRATSG